MEPLLSLAFSMQSNKGVYAVLLGSGISRSAQIPTGWEIVLELVRKLAHLHGEECEPNPAEWYKEKFKKDPDYAELLELVANTPTERQLLLRKYFEHTTDDKDEGIKQPTKAHRAIAQLVADGYVRVIVTTNFDQLMERALIDVGVTPSVVSTYDQIQGTLPLVHQHCCVVKVHGDYLDTRIKNTPSELETYDAPLNKLLDQIFDEFGLIISGWSADWDLALRAAIERAPSRRFTTYWAARGKLNEPAEKLVRHRAGKVIAIKDADSFFEAIQEKVKALEEFGEPHPLSVAAAVATTKRYLAEDKYRIRLYDLIRDEAERAAKLLFTGELANLHTSTPPSSASITRRVKQYDSICKNLVAIAFTCGYWGSNSVADTWVEVQKLFYSSTVSNGYDVYIDLQVYPLSLVTYAFCLGALKAKNYVIINKIVSAQLKKPHGNVLYVNQIVPTHCILEQHGVGKQLEGMANRSAPMSQWFLRFFSIELRPYFASEEELVLCFDRLEFLFALGFKKYGRAVFNPKWCPIGIFVNHYENFSSVQKDITDSLSLLKSNSPYVLSDLFGSTVEECESNLKEAVEFSTSVASSRW